MIWQQIPAFILIRYAVGLQLQTLLRHPWCSGGQSAREIGMNSIAVYVSAFRIGLSAGGADNPVELLAYRSCCNHSSFSSSFLDFFRSEPWWVSFSVYSLPPACSRHQHHRPKAVVGTRHIHLDRVARCNRNTSLSGPGCGTTEKFM